MSEQTITAAPAATAPAADPTGEPVTVDEKAERDAKINARAAELLVDLMARNNRLAPGERATEKQLWSQARKTAAAEIRSAAIKAHAAQIRDDVVADVRGALHRNRLQLAPWLLTTPYIAIGEGAWLLATYGDGQPIAISALCAATTAGASLLAWRRKLSKLTPAKFADKVKAGLGMLCAWSSALPLFAGGGQAGMWLTLLAGTSWMGLSWWRENQHPIPLPADLTDLALSTDSKVNPLTGDVIDGVAAAMAELGPDADPVEVAQAAEAARRELLVRGILADWNDYVTGHGTLPGSTLHRHRDVANGTEFRLDLVRGKQTIDTVRQAKRTICAALNLNLADLSIDAGADHATVILTVITTKASNAYTGPSVYRTDDGEICINIGPYEDGNGHERFIVLSDQLTPEQLAAGEKPRGSMHGGFALGTKGSGKSRLIEAIAVGLRALGIEIWYLDPQMGKSSPALMAEADWPLAGLHGSDGGYSNVVKLYRAAKAVNELRNAEGAVAGDAGFQHTKERPAIMLIIEECHGVFGAINPDTGNSFGHDFAQLDREMRKNGMGILCVSQAITQDTFGRGNAAAVLRDGVCATNVYALAYGGKNLGLLPGYDGQPASTLPPNNGYGYNTRGERPHVRYQATYTPDYLPWLRGLPKATLDVRASKRIGNDYLRRFAQYAADIASAQALLDQIDACDGDASNVASPGQQKQQAVAAEEKSRVRSIFRSPHAPRAAAAPAAPAADEQEEIEPGGDDTVLTDTERRVLDLIRTRPHNPTTLAAELAVTPQAAGKHLRNIASKGHAIKNPNSTYTAN